MAQKLILSFTSALHQREPMDKGQEPRSKTSVEAMSEIFDILSAAQKASQFAKELEGRSPSLEFATVTATDDPLKLRRIKCTTESKGGLTETDWLMALKLIPYFDPPIPPIGSSVVIAYIGGNPHDGVYLGSVINQPNPQDDRQSDPVADSSQTVPGDVRENIGGFKEQEISGYLKQTIDQYVEQSIAGYVQRTIEGNYTHLCKAVESRRTDMNLTIDGGQTVLVKNTAGASLVQHVSGAEILTASTVLILQDGTGNKIVLGGKNSSDPQYGGLNSNAIVEFSDDVTIDLKGHNLNIINAGGVSINGKQVATIDAPDTGGDTLTARGW